LNRLIVLALVLSVPSLAHAKPRLTIEDGWVHGAIDIEAPEAAVLAIVSDARYVARLDGRGATISVRNQGKCELLEISSPTPVGLISYTAEQCPVDQGFHSWLVKSDDFRSYEALWKVVPSAEGGVELTYSLHNRPTMSVPDSLVDRVSRRAVRTLLEKVKEEAEK
jgi:hypothetical protein